MTIDSVHEQDKLTDIGAELWQSGDGLPDDMPEDVKMIVRNIRPISWSTLLLWLFILWVVYGVLTGRI